MKNRLNLLKISSIVMVVSMITNPFIFTVCFTAWIFSVALCMIPLFGKDTLSSIDDTIWNNAIKYYRSRKYIKALIYAITTPMVIIGLCFAAIDLVIMWYNVLV